MAYRKSYRRFSRKPRYKRPMKRGRVGRRNVGRRSNVISTVAGYSRTGNNYRNKHVPYKQYFKRMLESSNHQQHYRTIQTLAAPITTGTTTGTWYGYRFAAAQNFWTTGGGYLALDTPASLLFPGDIFVRGGKYDCIIRNTETTQTVEVTTWWAKTKVKPAFTLVGSGSTVKDPAFDPSLESDFQTYYSFRKPVTTLLLPGQSTSRVEYQPAQKVDQQVYNTDGCLRYMWIFKFVNINATTAATCSIETRHSLSFTADGF